MRRSRKAPITIKRFRINGQIRAPKLRVIDEDDEHLGTMTTQEALKLAKEKDLDLIEVSPHEDPPVAKILEYGKHQYQQEKKIKKQKIKQKKVEVKGIRLSLRISSHDLDFRLTQAKKFLSKGNKLKIELVLRGRERQHLNLAGEIINKFIDSLKNDLAAQKKPLTVNIEQPLAKQGGRLSVVVAPK